MADLVIYVRDSQGNAMVRIIPRQDHDGLLTYADGIETAREAFIDYGNHPDYNETRHRVHAIESGVRVSVHQGVCPRVGGAGLFTHTERPTSDEATQDLDYEADVVHVLHDCETGELLGVFIGELGAAEISPSGKIDSSTNKPGAGRIAFRTACTTAVGLEALIREDANSIGIFGSGGQARNHLVAFDEVHDFETARVYSPTQDHRIAFAEEMPEVVDIDIQPVDSPDQVVPDVDVVLAATSASSPVFDGNLVEPGQTVISIVGSNVELVESGHAPTRRREIDNATVANADVVITNSIEQARDYKQADLDIPVEEGLISWDDIVPLRDVIVGNHPGRSTDEETILYKNNAGEGIVDVALARRTWDEVVDVDCGEEIDVFDPRA